MLRCVKYDLVIIGGGINGCGIARDAAGRGLSVLLVEQGDLAQATSSASTKLIHGGLRYLEQYDFGLVAAALSERERLLASAPHIIWPLEFILPHEPHLRPSWMIRIGLFLYDRLGTRKTLPASKSFLFRAHPSGAALKDTLIRGFSYADCWAQDARLAVLCAKDAAEKGAQIMTRTRCEAVRVDQKENCWHLTLREEEQACTADVQAACVVNATGPWARSFLEENCLTRPETLSMRLSKGSHIIVSRLYDGAQAYILQQPDGRIVFAIPYEGRYTLIGTTDVPYDGDPRQAHISQEEITYLCEAVNRSFKTQTSPEQVIWHYSGVRPLLDSGEGALAKVTRDYRLDLETAFGPPLLNIFGGKLTTFRKLAEQACDAISDYFPNSTGKWTARAVLPGGNIPVRAFDAFVTETQARYSWADPDMLTRYARAYGTRMERIFAKAHAVQDLGTHYGDHIYEAEIRYLIAEEWARSTEDILWRRSKLGLHIAPQTRAALDQAVPALVKEMIYEN
ncbi:MAG: glycerol-3-phosphate dehydrogenase [Rhodospirillales bacterium]|nr:glycerol-3-phosphate dehydrogenase [Rhodospirillales bacterium]MCB9965686.1 glycerol-3-phosphate dehydrogenase [Rhodospirillales bacterium]